jgi:hypothetical protein
MGAPALTLLLAPAHDLVHTAFTGRAGGSRLLECRMSLPMIAFLAFGACFGLLTYTHRHHFSEGPARRATGGKSDPMDSRVLWVLICSFLWPILALTGLYSSWRLARVRRPDTDHRRR